MAKQSKSLPTKEISKRPEAFSNKADGSMDYLSKQDSMASKDAAKLKKGAYKDPRYT
jgi:hypothetical protein